MPAVMCGPGFGSRSGSGLALSGAAAGVLAETFSTVSE